MNDLQKEKRAKVIVKQYFPSPGFSLHGEWKPKHEKSNSLAETFRCQVSNDPRLLDQLWFVFIKGGSC